MEKKRNPMARKLMEAFTQFHRLNWRQSPVAGLKPSEIMVLYCMKKTVSTELAGIKVSDLSSLMKVAAPTITQLVNGLEANGFVERTMDKQDRRAVRVKLTAEGERVVEKASDSFYEVFNGLAEYLGEEDSRALTELLSKVFTYFKMKKEND